jgi:hypothetical protein
VVYVKVSYEYVTPAGRALRKGGEGGLPVLRFSALRVDKVDCNRLVSLTECYCCPIFPSFCRLRLAFEALPNVNRCSAAIVYYIVFYSPSVSRGPEIPTSGWFLDRDQVVPYLRFKGLY